MNQLLFILVLGAIYCNAAEDDDSFSIGLGVLSPSYKQTVGKENVKVSFDQKENGQFSYSIGDPKTGYNSYLSFGGAAAANPAGNQAASPGAYSAPAAPSYSAPAAPAGYAAPAAQGYGAPTAQGYGAPFAQGYGAPSAQGYGAPSAQGYGAPAAQGYGAPAAQGYGAPAAPASGYQPTSFVNSPNYGYAAPSPASGYSGSQGQAYNSYPASSGAAPARQPEDNNMILPAGFSYHATEGQSFLRNQAERRQPAAGNILPAGFSYHATEGQSFLSDGGSPNFMVADEKRSSGLGPAESSFYQNAGGQQGGRGLVNGLVGYGPGGPSRGNVQIGGYAGNQGTFQDHGGHQ